MGSFRRARLQPLISPRPTDSDAMGSRVLARAKAALAAVLQVRSTIRPTTSEMLAPRIHVSPSLLMLLWAAKAISRALHTQAAIIRQTYARIIWEIAE